MADKRLARTRTTLPEGYQFGDARVTRRYITSAQADVMRRRAIWMTPAPGAVDRLRGVVGTLDVEYYLVPEGDPRLTTPAHVHDFACYDVAINAYICRCGAVEPNDVGTPAHGRVKRIMK